MAGFRIEGNTSGNIAEVNEINEIKVALNTTNSNSGYATITCASDDGIITGAKTYVDPEGSNDNRIRVGIDSLQLDENFPGTSLNTNIFNTVNSTMSVSVAGGSLTLNANSTLSASTIAKVSTYKYYPLNAASELYFEANIQLSQLPVPNNVVEFGLFLSSGIADPTDGIFFRLNSVGNFYAIASNNSVEIKSNAIDFTSLVSTNITKLYNKHRKYIRKVLDKQTISI